MNKLIGGKVIIGISAIKEENDGLDDIFSSKDHYLKELVRNNREVFTGIEIACSVRSVNEIRARAREKLVSINDIKGLNRACVKGSIADVKALFEKCFLEKEKDSLLKHFMNQQKLQSEREGTEKAEKSLLEGIKDLGMATCSHYILQMGE